MAAFRVVKAYYVAHKDVIVLAGVAESGMPKRGWAIDLPREVKGPGWVPIADVQMIPFQDGTQKLCVILDYEVVVGAPLMEFSSLEGLALDVRPV